MFVSRFPISAFLSHYDAVTYVDKDIKSLLWQKLHMHLYCIICHGYSYGLPHHHCNQRFVESASTEPTNIKGQPYHISFIHSFVQGQELGLLPLVSNCQYCCCEHRYAHICWKHYLNSF